MTADLTDVPAELRTAVAATLAAVGLEDGHLSVQLVDEARIRELNREHRGRDAPTDVLAFPIDGVGPSAGPREVGDVAICPEHCSDVAEAAVHGVLHLCGYDHETDEGQMLDLQAEILRSMGHPSPPDAEASRRDSRSSSAPASESGGGDGI
jgi:probable rRNA maturation factor